MIKLRDYQEEAVEQGNRIIARNKILIINYEVRLGKTHIAIAISSKYNKTLFVTKKKAISSILNDIVAANYGHDIEVTNYEQLHKFEPIYDLVIFDESHSLGAFPKPTTRTKESKRIVNHRTDVILMTGTLLPESNSQIYHQLYVSNYSPFSDYANFYKWHKTFGTPAIKYTSYGECADYSKVDYNRIKNYFEDIMITYTQKEAGFASEIKEHFIEVEMSDKTYTAIKLLKKDKVIEAKSGIILADTAVKEMQKIHQLYSGTIKFEDGSRKAFDLSKAIAIMDNFQDKKKAIFYKFVAELEAIKEVLNVTDNIEEFNTTNKDIALQIVSGREGINLSKADVLVYYNIDFSAVSYWQSRDRMTTINRAKSDVYWMFAKGGIEWQIYKAVINKKDFTLQTFKRWQASTNQA
jgi:hypothetical protein